MNIEDIKNEPIVQKALDEAWKQSNEGTDNEQEAGSWVYQCRHDGTIPGQPNSPKGRYYYTKILPIITGERNAVNTGNIPRVSKCRVVASFHTHPGPKTGGKYKNARPSPEDVLSSANYSIPGIIRYGTGSNTTDLTYGYDLVQDPPADVTITIPQEDGEKEVRYANEITETQNPQWLCPSTSPTTPSLQLKASCESPDEDSFEIANETSSRQTYDVVSSGSEHIAVVNDHFELEPGATAEVKVRASCACQCSPSVAQATINVSGGTMLEVPARLGCEAIPDCGGAAGDPHLWTYGGLRFDFQGAGEYVLTKSDDAHFEVQVRMEPWSGSVSVNTAVAVRIGSDRVGIYADQPSQVYINGVPTTIEPDAMHRLPGGGLLATEPGRMTLNSPEGDVVDVFGIRGAMSVYVRPVSPSTGLLSHDATADNQVLRTRDGRAFAAPLDYNQLYQEFGSSWLVHPEASLFEYAPGKSTADYYVPEFPGRFTSLSDIDPQEAAEAERICASYGVEPGTAMDDCIFDVAVTGVESFAALASSNTGAQDRRSAPLQLVSDQATSAAVPVLKSPKSVNAGAPFEVIHTGSPRQYDYLAVAHPTDAASTYDNFIYVEKRDTLTLRAPEVPGTYEVRYISGNNQTILARTPIIVQTSMATLDVTATVVAGAPIPVRWTGPANEYDYLAIARPEQDAAKYDVFHYVAGQETPLMLRAPEVAGRYEVRYVTGHDRLILARKIITVTDP